MNESNSHGEQLIFIHIPKTAGTSIIKTVLEPNLVSERVGPVREFWAARKTPCVHGHFPYGYHRLVQHRTIYSTVLRDPIDRAVSHYFFIKDLARTNPGYRHPLRDFTDTMTLPQFFEDPRFSDMQARYLAGIEFDRLYPRLHTNKQFRRLLLRQAMRHLRDMPVFGLQEQFAESTRKFERFLGSACVQPVAPQKSTPVRPTIQEIRDIVPFVWERLCAAHELDAKLYEFAVQRFSTATANPLMS